MPDHIPRKPGLVEPGRWSFVKPLSIAIAILTLLAGLARFVFGAGTARVTWDQAADCVAIDRWELVAAPITAAKPDPKTDDASIAATWKNAAPLTCGRGMQATTTITLAGPYRFWLRNVTVGANAYAYSDPVDRVVPLARPSGFDVAF